MTTTTDPAPAPAPKPSPNLLFEHAWRTVLPGMKDRSKGEQCTTIRLPRGRECSVAEIVCHGECAGDILFDYGVMLKRGRYLDYIGYLWPEDPEVRFEVFPAGPLCGWWAELVRSGPRWQREFGIVKGKEGRERVIIPIHVARAACLSRMGFGLAPNASRRRAIDAVVDSSTWMRWRA